MNSKPLTKSTKTKWVLLGLGAAAALGGLAYFLLSEEGEQLGGNGNGSTITSEYTDEQLIEVAKIFQKDFYPAYDAASQMARQMIMVMAMQTGQDPRNLPAQLKQEIIMACIAQNPMFIKKIEEIQTKVLADRNMDLKKYEQGFESRVGEVPALMAVQEHLQKAVELAGQGKTILPSTEPIPEELTTLKVFEIFLKTERASLLQKFEIFAEYLRNGQPINQNDPMLGQRLAETMAKTVDEAHLSEIDFTGKPSHPSAYYNYALETYMRTNKDGLFASIQGLEYSMQAIMQSLIGGKLKAADLDQVETNINNMGTPQFKKFKADYERKYAPKTVVPIIEEKVEKSTPVVVEEPTPVVVEETPAPVVVEETPAPLVEETPAPVVEETPAPVVEETPAPLVEETPAPVADDKKSATSEETPAPVVEEPTPVVEEDKVEEEPVEAN